MKKVLAALCFLMAHPAFASEWRSLEDVLAERDYSAYRGYRNDVRGLEQQFYFVCPDTFCEGAYGNLTPMDFTCALQVPEDRIKDCTWTFTGTLTQVDRSTGEIVTEDATFECPIEVDTDLKAFLIFLNDAADPGPPYGARGLWDAKVPGTIDRTMWKVLADCFP